MIEQIEGTDASVIGLRAIGKVTDEDYKTVLIPRLESAIEREGKIRFLFEFAENFRGYDLAAFWDDASFGLKHRNDFEKIAVVGGPAWIQITTRLFSPFVSAPIRQFKTDQFQDARDWLAC